MKWVFHDGGRAASGFIGLAGDCVPRAIAITTGKSYRTIYDDLMQLQNQSPRTGVFTSLLQAYLANFGWTWRECNHPSVDHFDELRSSDVYIAIFSKFRGSGHAAAVVDGTLYDTWDASRDDSFDIVGCFLPPDYQNYRIDPLSTWSVSQDATSETQLEYEKALRRLRALHNTATNHASTESEQHNALRMMQALMLRHNLSEEDLVDKKEDTNWSYARMACALNGTRVCQWELSLAHYITSEVFPFVQFFQSRCRKQSLIWFYGLVHEVENCIALFRELLLTIAASAKLKFGGYARGSGASYAEGFVHGLPRSINALSGEEATFALTATRKRQLIVHHRARQWLKLECDIVLQYLSSAGRYHHDDAAEAAGRADGATQTIQKPNRPLGLPRK